LRIARSVANPMPAGSPSSQKRRRQPKFTASRLAMPSGSRKWAGLDQALRHHARVLGIVGAQALAEGQQLVPLELREHARLAAPAQALASESQGVADGRAEDAATMARSFG